MLTLGYDDLHTAGEPVRIVTAGYPQLEAETILEKRREALLHHDHYRRAMMWEPRGHAGMYGVIPVPASHPEAAFGVLFTHHAGYSTMCGHATIALAKWAVETGRVASSEPVTRFAIEAPCGLIRIEAEVRGGIVSRARFESVPAFLFLADLTVEVPGQGAAVCDIAYGGAFYALVSAAALGMDAVSTPLAELVEAAGRLTDAIRATVPISHPDDPDLGFLYGTIVTDGAPPMLESRNVCVFAERQIDRSPTGSGVTARMVRDHAKGLVTMGFERRFSSVTGGIFTGEIIGRSRAGPHEAAIVQVGGRAHWMGRGEFLIDEADALRGGFELPATLLPAQRATST